MAVHMHTKGSRIHTIIPPTVNHSKPNMNWPPLSLREEKLLESMCKVRLNWNHLILDVKKFFHFWTKSSTFYATNDGNCGMKPSKMSPKVTDIQIGALSIWKRFSTCITSLNIAVTIDFNIVASAFHVL